MKLISLMQKTIVIYAFSVGFEHVDVLQSDGSFTLAKLMGIFLAISFFLHSFTRLPDTIDKRSAWEVSPILVFLLLLFIQNVINFQSYSVTVLDSAFVLNLFVFMLILRFMKTQSGLIERSLKAFVAGALISCVILNLGIGVEINSDGRHTIFGANYNELAFKFTAAFGLLLANFEKAHSGNIKRLSIVCCLLILVYGTILTGSRSAILAILITICIFSVLNESLPRSIRVVGVSLMVGFVVLQIINSNDLISRFALFAIETSETNDALGGRLIIWSIGFEIFQDSMIVGVGRSGYEHLVYLAAGHMHDPHNVLLETMLYTGIVGTLLILIFFIRIGSAAKNHYAMSRDPSSLYLAVPLILMIMGQQIFGIKIFWLMSAIILARSSKSYEEDSG